MINNIMKLIFKKDSEVAKVITEMYNKKEAMHKKAISIIEEETGEKIKEGSGLGYIYAFEYNYDYCCEQCYFEDGITEVKGYTKTSDKNGLPHFKINYRTKIAKIIKSRFNKEIKQTSSIPLNKFGIYTVSDTHYYAWRLIKEDNGEISMPIHPAIYNLIDFNKAKDVTIAQ